MATELDHDAIKSKIVAILQANTSLYTTTGETGELRSIEVGFPQGDSLSDKMTPYAFVTNSTGPFETIKTGTVISAAIKVLEHSFNYDITVVVLEKDSRTAETALDDFQKLILQTLEADHSLIGAGSASVDDSAPLRIDFLRIPRGDRGKGLKGRIITLRCSKVTG
jgi:hypothetical protein